MCCNKILCFFGWHKYESTDWLSGPFNITPYRRVRYHLLQCQRCCKLKNGDVYYGRVNRKKDNWARPLKNCKLKDK